MSHSFNVDDVILNFDPAAPHARFRAMGLPAEILTAERRCRAQFPGPRDWAPKAAPLSTTPRRDRRPQPLQGLRRRRRHLDRRRSLGDGEPVHAGIPDRKLVRVSARRPNLRAAGDRLGRAVQFARGRHGPLLPQPRPLLSLRDRLAARAARQVGTASRLRRPGDAGEEAHGRDRRCGRAARRHHDRHRRGHRRRRQARRRRRRRRGALRLQDAVQERALRDGKLYALASACRRARRHDARPARGQRVGDPRRKGRSADLLRGDRRHRHDGLLRLRRFDQPLRPRRPRPRLRHGRRDGRQRPSADFGSCLARHPQRLGPADPRPFEQHRRGRQAGRADLREVRRAHHRRQPDRDLGGHSAGAASARRTAEPKISEGFKLGRLAPEHGAKR